jgi:hypothetical protein
LFFRPPEDLAKFQIRAVFVFVYLFFHQRWVLRCGPDPSFPTPLGYSKEQHCWETETTLPRMQKIEGSACNPAWAHALSHL